MLSDAYTAGLIDGEGCIFISAQWNPDQTYKYYNLKVAVVNTNRSILEDLKITYGGHLSKVKAGFRTNGLPMKRKWQWAITGIGAVMLLKLISPYARIKSEEIRIGIEFGEQFPIKRRGGRSKHNPDMAINQHIKEHYRLLLQTEKRKEDNLDA